MLSKARLTRSIRKPCVFRCVNRIVFSPSRHHAAGMSYLTEAVLSFGLEICAEQGTGPSPLTKSSPWSGELAPTTAISRVACAAPAGLSALMVMAMSPGIAVLTKSTGRPAPSKNTTFTLSAR